MIGFVICLFNAALMVYTFLLFFDALAPYRFTLPYRLIICGGLAFGFSAILYFLPVSPFRSLLLVAMPIIASWIFELKWYNRLLLSILIFSIGAVSELITTVLISSFFSVNTLLATQGVFEIIGIILSKLITIVFVTFFRIKKYKILYHTSFLKIATLLLIPISTIFVIVVHVNLLTHVTVESFYLNVTYLVSYILLIASNIIVFQLMDFTFKAQEKDKQYQIALQLIETQKQQYIQLQEHNLTLRKIRHDQKNFLIGLISQLKNEQVDETIPKLEKELSILNSHEVTFQNGIIPTIIHLKSSVAKEHGIVIDVTYNSMQNIHIPDIDIAIMLGNALDNAIEATQKVESDQKKINITIRVTNDTVLISIFNPVIDNLNTNHLVSTKKDKQSHGLGILSIKSLAQKYNGNVLFTCEDHVFVTRIFLQNQNNECSVLANE